MSYQQRMSLMNATGQPRYVRVEPWERELLLAPGEKLEMVATGLQTALRVVEATDTTVIYTEGCDRVRVILDGVTYDHEYPGRDRIGVVPTLAEAAVPTRPMGTGPEPMWDRDLDGSP